MEKEYVTENSSSYKAISQKHKRSKDKYIDLTAKLDKQNNEIKKSNEPKSENVFGQEAKNLAIKNHEIVNKQDNQLDNMNKVGEEIKQTGYQIHTNLIGQREVLIKANEDLNAIRTDINQGKTVASRISNREFLYKVALVLLALVLLVANIWIIVKKIKNSIGTKTAS